MEWMCASDLQNNSLSKRGNGRDMRETWRVGGEIALESSSLTELQVKINWDLERKHGKTAQS